MKYDLKKPCKDCPFITTTFFSFPKARIDEMLSDGSFSCHKTTTQKGRSNDHKEAQSCAGRMILLEREQRPDQMMRIAERIGFYNHTLLEKDHPLVFKTIKAFRKARTA
jgi:hypothetical protein